MYFVLHNFAVVKASNDVLEEKKNDSIYHEPKKSEGENHKRKSNQLEEWLDNKIEQPQNKSADKKYIPASYNRYSIRQKITDGIQDSGIKNNRKNNAHTWVGKGIIDDGIVIYFCKLSI